MARQQQEEEGWPLGLQPLNVRVVGVGAGGIGAARRDYLGSMSFNNTLLSGSPPTSSTESSSDLDTESTGSFFHDRSITLGSLIGVSNILDLSRRSIRGRTAAEPSKAKKPCKSRAWFFSLCSRDSSTDVKDPTNKDPPSLGHFLAVERRSSAITTTTSSNSNSLERNRAAYIVPDEISMAQPSREMNSLFVNGSIAPPLHHDRGNLHLSNPLVGSEVGQGSRVRSLEHGIPVLFLCNRRSQVAH